MSDQLYRVTMGLLLSAIVGLLVAIPATVYLQERSVHVVFAPERDSTPAAAAHAALPAAPIAPSTTSTASTTAHEKTDSDHQFIRVVDSCDHAYAGECLRVRAAPSETAPILTQLRTGVVLPVAERVAGTERDWYRIEFTEWLRYPERVADTWYVAAEFVEPLWDEGVIEITGAAPTSSKRIVVDRSEQTLTALEDDVVFLETDISTGIGLTPTPRGQFTIFRKTPSRYMQGPLPYLPASTYYDLPGVPWNLYFTEQGAVIHGTYWHNSFGSAYSSGCVNLRPSEAKTLYDWAQIGTTVVVRD